MNVYLDSGDHANLERLAAQSPTAFDQFLAGWGARGCTLALSLHHAQELSQLADDTSRTRRLSLLEQFPVVRYEPGGSHKVVTFEVMAQMLARLTEESPDYALHVSPGLFQEAGLAAFKATVFESREFLVALQGAQGMTAKARDARWRPTGPECPGTAEREHRRRPYRTRKGRF